MTELATLGAYGALIEPATLKIERRLPGPIERVWAYLTENELRRQWLASGEMEMKVGAPFELVWRNDELTTPAGQRPEGFSAEHRMKSRIVALDPPHKLSIARGSTGGVTFDLEAQGRDVLLTVIHRRVAERAILLNVSAGWHTHLDILVARVSGKEPKPYWEGWSELRDEYDRRLPV
jgi:uncharacterized protein YndB with AHSA1/START domain